MWIFTQKGFISVTAFENNPASLMIQSRFPGHIEALFPNAQVTEAPYGRYRFRAAVQKHVVSKTLGDIVEQIDYFTFKSSIPSESYREVVVDAWSTLNKHDLGPGKLHEPGPEELMP